MKKYILTESQFKTVIDSTINELKFDLEKPKEVEFDIEPETVTKTPIVKITDIVKQNVNNFLNITKEKINNPENNEKIKNLLLKLEDYATKIGKALKTRKGQNRAILLTGLSSITSLLIGVYQAIFNSGLADWWNPFSFELGGVTFLKLALFLFVIRLILKVYRSISTIPQFLNKGKRFMQSIFNNKNKENITEQLIKYQII